MTERKIVRLLAYPWKVIFSPFRAFKEIAQNPDFKGLIVIIGLILLANAAVQFVGATKIFLSISERQPVSPRLYTYPDAYVYATAFGNYTFKSSQPYVMNYTFFDETPLIDYSIFWVNATEPLTPVNPVVTKANDTFYQTTVELYQSATEVGNLTLTAAFYSDSRPKISALMTKTEQWGLGDFTIVWFIRSTYTYESNVTTTVDLASKADLSLLRTNVDRAELGSTASPNEWNRSILIDWSDYGNATLYGGSHTVFAYSGSWIAVVFEANDAKIDPTTVGLEYSSLLTTTLFSSLLLASLIEAGFAFFINWVVLGGILLLVAKGLGEKVGAWKPFLILIGYAFSVTIIQWVISAALYMTLPEIRLQTISWPPTAQEELAVARNFSETWGPTSAFYALTYLTFPYINVFDVWLVALGAIAVHAASETETTWWKAAAISSAAFLIRFFLRYFLGL